MKTKTLLNSIVKSFLALFIISNANAQCASGIYNGGGSVSGHTLSINANPYPANSYTVPHTTYYYAVSSTNSYSASTNELQPNNGHFYNFNNVVPGTYTLSSVYVPAQSGCPSFTNTMSSFTVTTCVSNFSYTSNNNCDLVFTNLSTGNVTSNVWTITHPVNPTVTYTTSTITLPATTIAGVILTNFDNGSVCGQSTQSVICNPSTSNCQASFTYTTNPGDCYTYFTNTSAGTNLSYKWYRSYNGGSIVSLGTTTNINIPMPLQNGVNNIGLAIYSNGFYCDSTSQTLNINCTPTPTPTCNASYTYSTDANCVTHFTSTTTGTNVISKWIEKIGNTQYYLDSGSNPNLSFLNGTHTVILYNYIGANFCDSTMQTINITCNTTGTTTSCNASFTYSTDVNCVTHFTNTSTGGTNVTYFWALKIGSSMYNLGNITNPDLSLPVGTHTMYLASYSNGNLCSNTNQIINVACNGTLTPNCNASYTYSTDANCMTHFTNTTTGGIGLTYAWIKKTSSTSGVNLSLAKNPSLNLANGTYTIQLVNYSGGTMCDTITQIVTINCNNTPTCQVTSSINLFADSANPGNYFCYNQSTGNGVLSYLWDFGDGNTSTLQYPFHQYAQPGNYPVCLTTTNTNGTVTCTSTDCDSSSVQRMATGFLMSSINVVPQIVTGVKTVSNAVSFKAYPNPITDVLNIELAETNQTTYTVLLVDAIGREVIKKELKNNILVINTSTLQKGYYNLLLINEKGAVVKTSKLIK